MTVWIVNYPDFLKLIWFAIQLILPFQCQNGIMARLYVTVVCNTHCLVEVMENHSFACSQTAPNMNCCLFSSIKRNEYFISWFCTLTKDVCTVAQIYLFRHHSNLEISSSRNDLVRPCDPTYSFCLYAKSLLERKDVAQSLTHIHIC